MKRVKRMSILILAVMALVALTVSPVRLTTQTAQADNSHKLIDLRGAGLASITFAFGPGGILFSTSGVDTTDYPNARAEQRRSLRGPLLCWTKLDNQVISFGTTTNANPFVSVFIQDAANDLDSQYTNLMYLSSANNTARTSGFSTALTTGANTAGVTTLDSAISVADSLSLAAITNGAFGRYLRARFVVTPGLFTLSSSLGIRATVQCEISGDSILR